MTTAIWCVELRHVTEAVHGGSLDREESHGERRRETLQCGSVADRLTTERSSDP